MSGENQDNQVGEWLAQEIKRLVSQSPENSIKNLANDKAWDDPLIGFSSGDDPLYKAYRKSIGTFYWTHWKSLTSISNVRTAPEQLTVVSWILPQTELTRVEQRKQVELPAERWVRSYFYGEQFNNTVRAQVEDLLLQAGFAAVAPVLSPFWKRATSSNYGFASTWSERHAAYAAGLGTFGLCDGLITARGKAQCAAVQRW